MRKKNSYAQASDAVGVPANSAAHAAASPPTPAPAGLAGLARHAVWLPVILALAASLITLANDFACDDVQQIINNGLVKSLANAKAAFTTSVWQFAPAEVSAISQSYYRPLFNVWLMLNSAFFGSSAWGWHLLLVLLHGAAAAMVFIVIRQLFGRRELALIAACLFAVLPVHAEAVAWVSGGVEVLMTLLLLASLHFYLRYRQSGALYQIALALVFYLFALWTKEAALVFPFLVAYLELAHPGKQPLKSRGEKVVWMLAGLAIATGVYAWMRNQANNSLFAADETRLPLGPALLTIPLATIKYLALLIWPFGYSYQHYTLPATSVASIKLLVPLVVLAALIFVVARYGSRELRFAGGWFLITLAPVLLLMNRLDLEHLVQERYLYLPSLGFCLALALGVEWLAARQSFKLSPDKFAAAAVAAVVAFYSFAYIWHSRHWKDSFSVYRQAVAVAPDSAPALSALATELALAGRARDVEPSARRALELDPQYINGYFRLSYLFAQQGNIAKALDILEQARSAVPTTEINRRDMATLLLNLSRIYSQKKDHASAIECAEQSQALWPRITGVYYTGLAYFNAGRTEEALPYYLEATRRLPSGYAAIHLSLGVIYDNLHRLEEARDEYQTYITLAPLAGDAKNVQTLLKNVNQKIMLNGGSSGGTK